MADFERKKVVVSEYFDRDIVQVFEFGEQQFGYTTAKIFVGEIYNRVWNLDTMYLTHPECRMLTTKKHIYRNIILGTYLIIYRVTNERVEVLRIVNSKMSVRKIRTTRSIKM